ncbi:hypothetical protein NBRC103581_01609 [Gluconobacter wancherniae NBRC 103581]|nr:hypothetical protein NBRC103581_01609 [Gluconobacter wancherniae NBRC 103581]
MGAIELRSLSVVSVAALSLTVFMGKQSCPVPFFGLL